MKFWTPSISSSDSSSSNTSDTFEDHFQVCCLDLAREKFGFNELIRILHMSSATSYKSLRGDSSLTLDTLTAVVVVLGLTPDLSLRRDD